jgi:hypothetical protein
MQEKIEKYVQEYEKNAVGLVREYKLMKIFSWVSLFLILAVLILFIAKSSFAAACPSGQVQNYQGNCVSVNQAASEVNNPYSNSGGSNLSGLMSYGKNNISLTPSSCTNSSNFLNVEYSVTSSGDINAVIQMNTNNGSGYNYSYSIPVLISGVCSNGIISCPAGEWYGGGITCNNYAIQYNPSTGFSLEPLGSAIMGTPQSTSVNVPLNGTQVSTVTSTQTSGGLADCIDINDATGTTPASETEVQQVLTDLGGQITSAIQKGSSDIIGGVSQNTASSPYSATYSGGTCNSSNYNSPSNLEGLYNQGGSSLNNEVSSSEVATANSNTESALGLTSTPSSMLTTVQNNSFGGMSGGMCNIENEVNFDTTTSLAKAVFAPFNSISWSGGGSHTGASYTISNSGGNIIINQSESISYAGGPDCGPSGSITLSISSSGVTAQTSGGLFYCSGSIPASNNQLAPGTINCPDSGSCAPRFGFNITEAATGSNAINVSTFGNGAGWAPSNSYNFSLNDNVYYPVYSQPVNSCSTYINNSNCSLVSEQVCNENDTDCVTTLSNSNPVGAPPDFVWTYGQTDDNQPVSTITWTINMNGTSVNVTPSETNDTINYGTLATTTSTAGGGNDYPYITETYECTGNPPYNFSKMNQQETAVTGSASMNSNNTAFSYTGVNGNQHNNIAINNTVNNATQEECVVQKTNTNASISSSVQATTTTQNTPTSDTTTKTETLNCTNTGTVNNPSWSCPVPSGYTIQTNCTDASTINNNNFAPAMVELSVLDKAGSSLICSAN